MVWFIFDQKEAWIATQKSKNQPKRIDPPKLCQIAIPPI